MVRTQRLLGTCAILLAVAARVDAANVTLGWSPNSESDLRGYYVGYRSSPSGAETLSPLVAPSACTGSPVECQYTVANLTAGTTYYFRVYAENTSFLRSAPSNEVSTTIPTTPPPPTGGGLALERGALNYGAVQTSGSTLGAKTPSQRVMVNQTAAGSPIAWTAASVGTGSSRITVTPSSGSGTAPLTISLASTSLAAGTYTNTVRVTVGSTQLNIPVTTRVFSPGSTTAPTGVFDTPVSGTVNVAGSLPVTGWAVDDIGIARVDIYRDPVGSEPQGALIPIGTASLVSGSRSDIENLYPNAPLNYRGGWGYMVLTNMLPDVAAGRGSGGNGSFRLHAYAIDYENRATYLGVKNFQANNAASAKPFGALDTPSQGGTASGSNFMVYGWALAPRGTIPTNGSTITQYVDGAPRGTVTYNQYRSDIATLFPGYANTNGAIGFSSLNTTTLANGTHTITWVVYDNLGNAEGIGSRFFTVQNGTSALTSAGTVDASSMAVASAGEALGQTVETVSEVPPDYSMVEVRKAASDDSSPQLVFPEWLGEIRLRTREAELVEVRLASQFDDSPARYEGYVVVGGRMRPLPVGSTLNTRTGAFSWQPGPGFIGKYDFVFLRTSDQGLKTRIPVEIRIGPKHDDR
jgi:hypothetical protein